MAGDFVGVEMKLAIEWLGDGLEDFAGVEQSLDMSGDWLGELPRFWDFEGVEI